MEFNPFIMKRMLLAILVLLVTSFVFYKLKVFLSVSFSTTEYSGGYKPRHVVVVWVEDSYGYYVKTLLAYANVRKIHLNAWKQQALKLGLFLML